LVKSESTGVASGVITGEGAKGIKEGVGRGGGGKVLKGGG